MTSNSKGYKKAAAKTLRFGGGVVLPAALGFSAPLAVLADTMASLGGHGAMNTYMLQQDIDEVKAWRSQNQVTSVNQFSDVKPTDWAYQALSNLVERYGCVAGYPNGTYKGGQAMTRYEAAALLNACLDRVTETTDELKRLQQEFSKELAVLKGKVDGLESRVGELEAMQFSSTTKLRGKADMILGGTSYTGNYNKQAIYTPGKNKSTDSSFQPVAQEALTFNYRLTLDLDTSFTGRDLLYTRLRTGNFANSAFSGSSSTSYVPLAQLEDANNNQNVLQVDKLWYQFPVGNNWQFYIGPRIENYYMLAVQPTLYANGDFILKNFKDRGAPGVYGNSTGSGAGFWWRSNADSNGARLSWSNSYVARTGDNGNPAAGGIATNNGEGKFVSQLAYGSQQWQVSTAYAYTTSNMTMGRGTTDGAAVVPANSNASSLAINAFWQPVKRSWIPSISLGYEVSWFNLGKQTSGAAYPNGTRTQSMSWMTGLQWDDAFVEGNVLGFGLGGPQWVTKQTGGVTPNDGNMAFELWYKYQVTDNISVTPAVFYLSRPFGQDTGTASGANPNRFGGAGTTQFGTFGYLLKTTFRF